MFKRLFIAVLLIFTMTACDNLSTALTEAPTTSITYHSISLENTFNDTNRDFDSVAYGETIALPVDEIEGKVFVGWSDGENIYNNTLTVETSLSLQAIYEDVSSVFEYSIYPLSEEITITGYLGNSKYLRIPNKIDGYIVRGIASYAFEESPIIQIELPTTIMRVYPNAFINLQNLEKVSFYGEFLETEQMVIGDTEYNHIIEENNETCQIVETTENGWKFSEGCPIIEVLHQSDPIIIPGNDPFCNYIVLVDSAILTNNYYKAMIDEDAFINLPKLTTFDFPYNLNIFFPSMFNNTPKLSNLTFPDKGRYFVNDNIVYRSSSTSQIPGQEDYVLVYYPQGLTNKEFTVSNRVKTIGVMAFYGNDYLEEVNMSDSVTSIGFRAFTYNQNLKAINLEANDSYFYTIDGILYNRDVLVTYPMSKEDTHFIVPEETEMIAAYAFYGQKYLEFVSLNNGLESIGHSAFAGVKKIELINVPSSVRIIDLYFARESSIETVIINRSLVVDGSLTIIRASLDSSSPQFFVPDDSYEDYLADMNWIEYYNFINPISELEIES
jgi:hypothetical protein